MISDRRLVISCGGENSYRAVILSAGEPDGRGCTKYRYAIDAA